MMNNEQEGPLNGYREMEKVEKSQSTPVAFAGCSFRLSQSVLVGI